MERKIESGPAVAGIVTAEADVADYWKDRALSFERELASFKRGQTATEILVQQVKELAPKSYSARPLIDPPRIVRASSAQSAVALLSDTHVGAYVRAEQTLGFGQYDFNVFTRRLKRYENSIISIRQDHTTTKIDELVVVMLGDMIDGALQHAAECGQVNTLFHQFYGAGHAIAQFLRNLSPHFPAIRVHTCVGNHPRWANQKKMPTKNRFSNLDQFLYAYVDALVRDIPSIKFNLNEQPLAEFDVKGFTFLAGHGDHLRGGDKALGIPSHSIGRAISATTQLRLKASRPGVNYYLVGHLHRPYELAHAMGDVIINGGFPGVDEFGLMQNFSPCVPSQKLFFVHPKHGRAACYNLDLTKPDMEGAMPYQIPGDFTLR